ncbi:MAG: zinc-ribbon domain-containing protein [Eubacteriales bacterium]
MFFIGIFGIEDKAKELKSIRNIVCPACGRYAAVQILFTYTFFHIFFIPIIKWNKAYFVRMSCCGAVYSCTKDAADGILETGTIDFAKCTNIKDGSAANDCPYCGSRVAGYFTYCPFCGNKL